LPEDARSVGLSTPDGWSFLFSLDYRIAEPGLSPGYARRAAKMLRGAVQKEETTMRKTILTMIAASLIAASSVPAATASERHPTGKADRAATNERFRNSNAFATPAHVAVQPDWSRYIGAMSAPAGR
jgi:hypothetical protein